MRVVLTMDRDAVERPRNDYVTALLQAGFERGEIEVLGPGSAPSGPPDALVLGGGCDVEPSRYGQAVRPDAGVETDPGRDALDFEIFRAARREGIPVLAICRGLQVVNAALGGTLVQDIPSEVPSAGPHDVPGADKTRREHPVRLAPGSLLASLAGAEELSVNSRHHQAIATLAPHLTVTATAPDGVVEGVEGAGPGWLVGVQWHPENLAATGDAPAQSLFDELARVARALSAGGIRCANGGREILKVGA
ncbi:MAG: gamma-glutamyl-gamma-aminobutyrate hydrolase family protein [Acidobacteriota bacterium]